MTKGGATISEYIGIGEILRFHIASGTYTYTFTQGGQIYTDELVLTDDGYYTVTDLDLWDIMNKPDNSGGDDDTVELEILNRLTGGIIGLFALMFILQIDTVQDMIPGKKRKPRAPKPPPEPWDGDRRRK